MLVFKGVLLHLCNIMIKKGMKKREIMNYLWESDLKASEVVKFSGGFVGLNQASGWIRELRKGQYLSNPVTVMLWKILIERDGIGVKQEEVVVTERRVSAEWVDTSKAVGGWNGYYKGSDKERLDKIERDIELKLSVIRGQIALLKAEMAAHKKHL